MHDEQLAIQRGRIALDSERLEAFERGLEEGGYQGAQRGIADVLAARYGKPGKWVFNAYGIVLRYIDAGETELAMDWLEKAFEEHDVNMQYLGLPLLRSRAFQPALPGPAAQDEPAGDRMIGKSQIKAGGNFQCLR